MSVPFTPLMSSTISRPLKRISILLLLVLTPALAFPASPLTGNALNDGYHDMYNLQFLDAHLKFEQWMASHPADPMGPVSDAAAWLFSEFDRLHIIDVTSMKIGRAHV